MKHTRRTFLAQALSGLSLLALSPTAFARNKALASPSSKPWLELSRAAYLHNATQISKMVAGKPVMAVLKNNAYGLGDTQVASILAESEAIAGIAVVKDERALAIRAAGVKKPILLMGDFDSELADELVKQDITVSVFSAESLDKMLQVAEKSQQLIKIALYIDTGLGRMGIPYQGTIHLAEKIAQSRFLQITQTFSTLTTPQDFAQEQIVRFEGVIQQLEEKGIPTGVKHLAPSYSLLNLLRAHQDAVRPGILLHGSFPLAKMEEAKQYPLQVPFRLKASVIRLEKLNAGDSIGFSRFYKIEQDEWIATLPVGWADGYYSGAENGAKVLLGDRLYPVVNVNASHTNISLGAHTSVKLGDEATLIGPDRPEITPEGFAQLAGGHNYLQIDYKESLTKQIYETF